MKVRRKSCGGHGLSRVYITSSSLVGASRITVQQQFHFIIAISAAAAAAATADITVFSTFYGKA